MRIVVRSFSLCLLAMLMLSGFSGNTFASTGMHTGPENSVSKNSNRPAGGCLHQLVHLNGYFTPTITCLDQKTQNGVAPDIGTVSCGQALVELISTYYHNDTVCFSGDGFINLNAIYMPCAWPSLDTCGTPWFGQAQEYQLYACATNVGLPGNNDYPGYFASDFNGNGTRMYFKSIPNQGAISFDGHGLYTGPYSLLINC